MRFDWTMISRFERDRRGAVALLFGLSLFVLCGATGLAIDMSRAFNLNQKISAALDAAALSAAKLLDQDTATDAQIQARAISVLNAHTNSINEPGLIIGTPSVVPNRSSSTVEITVSVQMPTTFAQVIGIPSVDFSKSTKVAFLSQRIELALVLDVTGSMNDGGKLAAMKVASKNVIDSLVDPANPTQSRIAIVPYSASVNMGTYATAASGGDSLDGCVMERLYVGSRDNDDVSGGTRNFAVNGQLNSSSNGRYVCPAAVLQPLSSNATALKATIDSYSASGYTGGHMGLAWGWNTVSPNWASVFTGPAAPGAYGDTRYVKAIVLMTDGIFNTSYTAGTSDAEQTAESAARTNALCAGIKARNITIYTVAFQAPVAAETLLRNCASSTSHYYDANDSAQLISAFQAIVEDLQKLHIMN